MDFLDKAKDLAEEHGDKVEGALDKIADIVDEKTGGKHHDKIESAVDKAKGFLGGDGDDGKKGDPQTGDREPPSGLPLELAVVLESPAVAVGA